MRTTVSIDDELLHAARQRAREEGTTLGGVVETALRRLLSTSAPTQPPPNIPVFTGGTGPRPGLDLTSNRALSEALDDGQPLEQLR
ncbi:MAG TPA: type II toxin-antitoxin system VapB family antitoxin [Mycobacteriales bacterium]|nr:type II toxin-antitoxin system VapB family antitoxin [Mycobacteriales bacterium]